MALWALTKPLGCSSSSRSSSIAALAVGCCGGASSLTGHIAGGAAGLSGGVASSRALSAAVWLAAAPAAVWWYRGAAGLAGLASVSVARAVAQSRPHRSQGRWYHSSSSQDSNSGSMVCLMAAPSSAVVDAGGPDAGDGAVAAVLEHAERHGVPVRSQRMEYVPLPTGSPVRSCGVPALASQDPRDAIDTLVRGLKVRGLDEDRAEVGAAVLLLMLRGIDEAHNIVTPHSWPAPTPFGGSPKLGSTVAQDATYCHVIIHRMEGEHLGEYGTGFHNSQFWMGKAFGRGSHPIFPKVFEAARALAQESTSSEVKAMVDAMSGQWGPGIFNALCENALQREDADLLAFCGAVQKRELRLLLDHITAETPAPTPA